MRMAGLALQRLQEHEILHVCDRLCAGATREEIQEAIGVAVLMGGGPAMVYGSHALEALEQFESRERALVGGMRT